MQVEFKVNLGGNDARAWELDFSACVVGAVVEVSDAAGKWLVSRGIALDVTPPREPVPQPEPQAAEEIASDPATQEPETPEPVPQPEPGPRRRRN